MKNTEATNEKLPPALKLPSPAIWIQRQPNDETLRLRACTVLEIRAAGARIEIRERNRKEEHLVLLGEVASSPEKAYEKAFTILARMLTRSPDEMIAFLYPQVETPSFLTPSLSGGERITTEVSA